MRVPVEKLRKVCDPESLRFETTENVNAKDGIVGQKKAFEALRVGVGVKDKNFNIFVSGPSDTGKTRLIKRFLEKISANDQKLLDWCYVYNFQEPDRPRPVSLPGGKAGEFREDISDLIAELRKNIPLFFESAEWKQKLNQKLQSFETLKKVINAKIRDKMVEYGFKIIPAPTGNNFAPVDPDDANEVMPPEKYNALPDEEKEIIREKFETFREECMLLEKELERLNAEAQKVEEKLKEEEMPRFISDFTVEFQEKYHQNPDVLDYLDSLIEDIIRNIDRFSNGNSEKENRAIMGMGMAFFKSDSEDFFRRYEVNILVDHSRTEKIPVVVETNPTYSNLFGSVESEMKNGILSTSFSNIRAGALHRANNGYLIIPAYNLLKQPIFCWEALKRTIKDQEIRIEPFMNTYFGGELKSLKPQPIPFNGKIILIGDDWLYHVLYTYDDQFKNIFEIKIEMAERTERTPKMILDVISVLAAFCAKNNLRPFDKTAASRIIEYLSELAENQKKLSLRLGEAENVLKEANFWAGEAKKAIITSREINKALRKKAERVNLIEDRLLECHKDEILKIKTSGSEIGKINGLAVYSLGDYSFGLPVRLSARVGLGEPGIINVEKECDLAGNIQTKSVFVVNGYLLGRYAQEQPVSVSASLCFEQSYSGVEGDSASIAELAVVISALAEIPIKQNIAVTGSMNQYGEVQAIGGVNYKIKGFFKVCCLKGRLTGDQGVIIPKDNIDELMLPREIVKAVKGNKFNIFAVSTVEEAMKYLTGYDMDEIDRKIAKRLKEFNDILEKRGKKKRK